MGILASIRITKLRIHSVTHRASLVYRSNPKSKPNVHILLLCSIHIGGNMFCLRNLLLYWSHQRNWSQCGKNDFYMFAIFCGDVCVINGIFTIDHFHVFVYVVPWSLVRKNVQTTVWKFQDFPITQFLRDIHFRESRRSEAAILGAPNFANLVNFNVLKLQKFIEITIHSL